jgi:hypothetical protein
MVSAAVRKGTVGNGIFYDFDFAIAPKTCNQDKEMLVGSCMYEKVKYCPRLARPSPGSAPRLRAGASLAAPSAHCSRRSRH